MPSVLNKYRKRWNEALKEIDFRESNSFFLPIIAIPLVIKGAKIVGKAIKEKIDEKKGKENA
ncbi:MAG: hypothetical protein V3V33_12530 [Candidatus Lokiarchaeia archaeon]